MSHDPVLDQFVNFGEYFKRVTERNITCAKNGQRVVNKIREVVADRGVSVACFQVLTDIFSNGWHHRGAICKCTAKITAFGQFREISLGFVHVAGIFSSLLELFDHVSSVVVALDHLDKSRVSSKEVLNATDDSVQRELENLHK